MRRSVVMAAAVLSVAAVLACPGCTGIGRALGAGDAPAGPSFVPARGADYPQVAQEMGLTARVGLECWVDARGSAQDIVIRESGGLVFDDAARKLFSQGYFLIPPDWSASGGPQKHFLYGVIFQLRGKPEVAHFADNRLTVVVKGSGTS